jgi:hypothetical protein
MSGTARVVLVNYPHHGMQRGDNRQVVFAGNDKYLSYLEARIKLIPFTPKDRLIKIS